MSDNGDDNIHGEILKEVGEKQEKHLALESVISSTLSKTVEAIAGAGESEEVLPAPVQDTDEIAISSEFAGVVFGFMQAAKAGVISEEVSMDMIRQFYEIDTGALMTPDKIYAVLSHKKIYEYFERVKPNLEARTARISKEREISITNLTPSDKNQE